MKNSILKNLLLVINMEEKNNSIWPWVIGFLAYRSYKKRNTLNQNNFPEDSFYDDWEDDDWEDDDQDY